ncbi:MAG: putative Ig domain-containing protein, partial [Acidobacteriota bacterium]|nr:putative Ig domain-containing protein [Acidobacteriota bacterium]
TGTATVTSLGHNLDSDGMSGFTNGVNGDLIGSSGAPLKTLLAPLGNYGGPTQTHALLPGSLAINAGDNTVTSAPLNLTTDQRSTARPQQGSVDIGAYESQGFTLVIAGGNNQSTPLNTTFANPLAVTVSGTFGEPVSGGLVTFTPPGSGASATITGSPATISASGQAGINVTANSITGAYTVTATTQGGDTINFQLTNLCPSLALLPNTLANGIANMTYNQNLSATPTGTTYSFAVSSGNLPPGLMLNSVSGAISGTPVQVGTFTFTVTVTGFGTCSGSRAYTLTINNPVPVLASLNPNAATAGGGALILAVTGTNFVNGSLVRWNGADRPTTFVSSTQLTASIPASDIANAGSANVTVFNPTPGGSVSDGLSFTINPQGYEADVAPRPNGDNSGAVTITDWVQIGRFVAGLDTTANGSEFQRADCAPRDTLGDGRLSISDWVQAGRYAAGIDPVVAAGGPTMPAAGTQLASTGKPSATGVKTGTANGTQRTMRLSPGIEAGKIAIELDALGDENALGWSLRFDPSQWRFVAANAGNDARSATLHVNARQAASGHIGLALALPAGQTLPVGARQIVVVSFAPVGTRHDSGVMAQFADYPVAREAVGVEANALPASFVIRAQISLRERERQRKDSGVKHSARRIR